MIVTCCSFYLFLPVLGVLRAMHLVLPMCTMHRFCRLCSLCGLYMLCTLCRLCMLCELYMLCMLCYLCKLGTARHLQLSSSLSLSSCGESSSCQ